MSAIVIGVVFLWMLAGVLVGAASASSRGFSVWSSVLAGMLLGPLAPLFLQSDTEDRARGGRHYWLQAERLRELRPVVIVLAALAALALLFAV